MEVSDCKLITADKKKYGVSSMTSLILRRVLYTSKSKTSWIEFDMHFGDPRVRGIHSPLHDEQGISHLQMLW